MKQIKRYLQHIRKHDQVMQELEEATKKYKDFEVAYKEFEVQVSLSHCQLFSRRSYLPPLPDRHLLPICLVPKVVNWLVFDGLWGRPGKEAKHEYLLN